jgi:hypothetical protein
VDTDNIPQALLARHPELVQVNEVLTAYYEGIQVSIHCVICDAPLTITHMEATDGLWVRCATGCTTFRVRRSGWRSRNVQEAAV